MGILDMFRKDRRIEEPKAPETPRPKSKSSNELQDLYETYGPEAATKFDNDAKKFAEILKGAAKLLQYTEQINIRVTKE